MRFLGLLLLCVIWIRDGGNKAGVLLLLFLTMMTLSRWRFKLPAWSVLIDEAACLLAMTIWPHGAFGLVLPVFEGMLAGRWWFALLAFVMAFLWAPVQLLLMTVLAAAAVFGSILRGWSQETEAYRKEADQLRLERYELENLQGELLWANAKTAQMAELAERNRIAQELHDDVGHEITAAVLAFQAFEQLWREGDPSAEEMFLQAQQRLNKSAVQLRERVHNMRPLKGIDAEVLQDICDSFTAFTVDFRVFGDTSRVPVYLWSILEPCLKEALTNVVRHAKATKVAVSLDINLHIVRLRIHNDGTVSNQDYDGIGLRNLKQRARAAGGNISIDLEQGFGLTCVLPITAYEGGQNDENFDCR